MPQFDDLERALAGFLECQDFPDAEAEILAAYADVRHLIEPMLGRDPTSEPPAPSPELDRVAEPPSPGTPAPETPAPETPKTIRHYEIVRELGRGGMGVVYEGYDTQLDRRVAIKSIHWDQHRDQLRIERFRREAQLLASLHHPNIGAIYSFERAEEGHFLILEHVEGETLRARLKNGRLEIQDATAIASQIADALAAAHDQGVAHRDLSPSNVMVRIDGKVKVLDFGLARSIGDEQPSDRTQSPVMGTPSYMSPETLRGGRSRKSADVWAFGCLLFEALTGTRAFDAPNDGLLVGKIMHVPPPFERLPRETPESVVQLLKLCFEKDPAQRLESLHLAIPALTDGSFEGLPASGQQRVEASPLQRSVRVGDPVQLRLFFENGGHASAEFEVEVATGDGWDQISPPLGLLELPAETTREQLVILTQTQSGSRRLPEIRVRVDGEQRTIQSVPSRITVEDSAHNRPVLPRREWESLESSIASIASDSGVLHLIVGAAGTGRTVSLDHVDLVARGLGIRVLRANARSGVGQRLKLVHDLLRSLLCIVESEQRDALLEKTARRRLGELFGRGSPSVEFFLSQLLGQELEPEDSPTQQYRWYRLIASLTQSVPCVALVDDLEHADPASLELLLAILERCHEEHIPFAVVGTMAELPSHGRAEPTVLDRLVAPRPRLQRTVMTSITAEEIDALLALRYPGSNHLDYSPGLADAIHTRSGGHLGMIEEMIEALSRNVDGRQGFFRLIGTSWSVRPEVTPQALLSAMPSQYVDLLALRVDEMTDEGRAIFETAGLLGTEIPISVLEALFEEGSTLDDGLDQLESLGILLPTDPELTQYRFQNPSFATIAVRQIELRGSRQARRRRLEVSKCLQDLFSEPRYAEELGLRLLELGDFSSALPPLMKALEQHVRLRQAADADQLAARVTEIVDQIGWSDPRRELEWLALEGRVHTACGRLERAEASIRAAFELAEQLDDVRSKASSLVQLSEIAFRRGQFEQVCELAQQARVLARAPELERIQADAVQNLATAFRRLGDRDRARELWEENRRRYVAWSDRSGEARATNNLGILHYEENRLDEAERCFRITESIGCELDNLDFQTHARVWLSNVAFKRGDLEAARSGYIDAVSAFQKVQNRRALSRCYYNLSEVEALLGNLDAARPAAERAAALCAEMSDRAAEAEYRLSRAGIEWLAGEDDCARCELRDAREVSPAIAAPIRRRAFEARAALLEDLLGDSQPLVQLAAQLELGQTTELEIQLLEATVRMRAKHYEGHSLSAEAGEEARDLIRRAGPDTLTESVGLATTLQLFAEAASDSIEELLGFSPSESPAAAWIELALPKLTTTP